MHPVRSSISHVGEKSAGQFTLDVEVPLLDVAVFGSQVRRQAGRSVCRHEGGKVRSSIAPRRQADTASAERSCLSASEASQNQSPPNVQFVPSSVLKGVRPALVVAVKGVVARATTSLVGVHTERRIVRNPEDSIAAPDYSLLVEAIGEPEPRREFLLVQRHVVTGVVRSRLYIGTHRRCKENQPCPRNL